MRRFWIPSLALAALALAACGGDNGDTSALRTQVASLQTQVAQAGPDRVVGIERHCQTGSGDNLHPMAVGLCDAVWDQVSKTNPPLGYLEIIVRTAQGPTYRIQMPATTKVAIGDVWPPH